MRKDIILHVCVWGGGGGGGERREGEENCHKHLLHYFQCKNFTIIMHVWYMQSKLTYLIDTSEFNTEI